MYPSAPVDAAIQFLFEHSSSYSRNQDLSSPLFHFSPIAGDEGGVAAFLPHHHPDQFLGGSSLHLHQQQQQLMADACLAPPEPPKNPRTSEPKLLSVEHRKKASSNLGRKRGSKKDRHSKIFTRHGPRDRRMRLSLDVARKFFDLQDMLGFDKASQTVDWLLTKSSEAIENLSRDPSHGQGTAKSAVSSSVSEGEVVSALDESLSTPEKAAPKTSKGCRMPRKASLISPLSKEERTIARARARERTKTKKMIVTAKGEETGLETGSQSNDKKSSSELLSVDHQSSLGGEATDGDSISILHYRPQRPSISLEENSEGLISLQSNGMLSFPPENWRIDQTGQERIGSPIFRMPAPGNRLQPPPQFSDLQFFSKPWEGYNS